MVYVPQSVGFSCGKIYQKDALSGLSFPEGIPIREDAIFNIQAFMAAKKIVVTNLRGYHYIINGQSATGRFRFNYTSEAKTFLNKCLQLWDDYNLPINSYHIGVLYTYMSWLKMYALNANAPFTKQQKIQLLQESFEDEVYSDSFNRVAKNTLNYQYKLLRLLFVNKSTAGIQTMFLLYKVKGKMK